jgi:hypothetical protein
MPTSATNIRDKIVPAGKEMVFGFAIEGRPSRSSRADDQRRKIATPYSPIPVKVVNDGCHRLGGDAECARVFCKKPSLQLGVKIGFLINHSIRHYVLTQTSRLTHCYSPPLAIQQTDTLLKARSAYAANDASSMATSPAA